LLQHRVAESAIHQRAAGDYPGLNERLGRGTIKRMRTRYWGLLLVAALLSTLLPGCGIFPRRGPSALVGTWTNQTGTVWTIREDGNFEVDLDGDGKREASGKYSVDGDMVTLRATGGYMPKGCKGKGLYHFDRSAEDKLQFTLVNDACTLRRKNVLQVWHLKK
jgi:hypothetical protein